MLRLVHKNELRTQIVSVGTPCATKLIMHARLDFTEHRVRTVAYNTLTVPTSYTICIQKNFK